MSTGKDVALKDLFKQAAEIASSVPESMHGVAFSRALDELMAQSGLAAAPLTTPMPPTPSRSDKETVDAKNRLNELMERLDRTKYPEVTSALSALDRSLHVLRAARELGVDGLTPPELSRILTDKFRVATTRSAVGMALSSAGSLVDRRREGSGYLYRLMEPGDQYLSAAGGKRGPATPSSGARSRSKKSSKGSKSPSTRSSSAGNGANASTAKRPRRRASSARPGPKQMVESLIDQGFFDKPQTIAAIIEHVRSSRGHTYKTTDLSPTLVRLLREDRLTRNRNADSQYEYTRST